MTTARLLISALTLAFLSTTASAQWPVQSCAFGHRIPVTLTANAGGNGDEIRIDLSSANFPSSYTFSADGDDVRVFAADDTTPVPFFIAAWDPTARSATIYLRLSALAAGGSQNVSIYLGDNSLGFGGSPETVFPENGIRLRSRVSNANPTSVAGGLAAFNAGTSDVFDDVLPTVNGRNNRSLGGGRGNFGWCVSAILDVTTPGTWDFRYGGDFGRGGDLKMRGEVLEEDWNDDLWWAGNYNNAAEVLQGSINLPSGWHRFEIIGFEGCCDGPVGLQARPPGGAWQDLTTANFSLRGAQCISTTTTAVVSPGESCATNIDLSLSVETDGTSPRPFQLPNSIVRYDIVVTNPGQAVDDSTVVLTQEFPAELLLQTTRADAFTFTDGPVPSGLGFTYGGPASTTDSVEFSTDGVNFNYVPAGPEDGSVTHMRFRPSGSLNPNSGGASPSFTISFLARVP